MDCGMRSCARIVEDIATGAARRRASSDRNGEPPVRPGALRGTELASGARRLE